MHAAAWSAWEAVHWHLLPVVIDQKILGGAGADSPRVVLCKPAQFVTNVYSVCIRSRQTTACVSRYRLMRND